MQSPPDPAASRCLDKSHESILLQFEEAWQQARPYSLAAYWKPEWPQRLLVELVLIDLERRLKAKQKVRVESYLRAFPTLRDDHGALRELVRSEQAIRAGLGEQVPPDECEKRFPFLEQFQSTRPHSSISPPAGAGLSAALHTTQYRDATLALPVQTVNELVTGANEGDTRYRIGQEIARGGMGVVVRAVDRDIRREVAVKYLLDQKNRQGVLRLIEEAQITGQLEHPNIVPIHELGVDGQRKLFFAMKLVKGQSLAQVLERVSSNPAAEKEHSLVRLLNVFVGVCNAIAYAHARGVIHRDLKPANIMLGDFGEVYVMDWGLAKVLRQARTATETHPLDFLEALDASGAVSAESPSMAELTGKGRVVTNRESASLLTQDGSIVGTPVYMPPEQASGKVHELDERSDIYSLGTILYQILTLEPPIETTGGYAEVIRRVNEGEIVPPALRRPDRARAGKIPAELAAIALKAMAWSPGSRYPSVEEMRRDVELFLEGRTVSAKEDTRAELLMKFVRRNKAFSATVAASLVLIAAAIVLALIVNFRARREAEDAYAAYEKEQKEKLQRTRQTIPALIQAAQQEAAARRIEQALKQVLLALEYDPDNSEGKLLLAQLLLARQQFSDAAATLAEYSRLRPKDRLAFDLRRLCDSVADDNEEKNNLVQMAQILALQDHPILAEELLLPHVKASDPVREELLSLFRNRLTRSWPGESISLTREEDRFHFSIRKGKVRDLTPLRGIPLSSLDIESYLLRDLKGVEGMPLTHVQLTQARSTNLDALRGANLTSIHLESCKFMSDLDALKGMPLTSVAIVKGSAISNLSALSGMALTELRLEGCAALNDISALKGMPIERLEIIDCPALTSLAPLQGMRLASLSLKNCSSVRLFSDLRGMPLAKLNLSGCSEIHKLDFLAGSTITELDLSYCPLLSDLEPLRGLKLKSLKLNGCKRVKDLSPLQDMPLVSLELAETNVHLLEPLRNSPLTRIHLADCRALTTLSGLERSQFTSLDLQGCVALENINALRDMSLNSLDLSGCVSLADLSPLGGTGLNKLTLDGCTKVADLTPLKDSIFTHLSLRDCTSLKDLKGLEAIRFNELDLSGCSSLVNLNGLKSNSLKTLRLSDCTRLESLAGVEGVPLEKVQIRNCPALVDLSSIRKLVKLTTLTIEECASLSSIAGLEGVPLNSLTLADCPRVSDLGPLRGSKLKILRLPGCTSLSNLKPLMGVPLQELDLSGSAVEDLSALSGGKLQRLWLHKCFGLADLSPLKGMPIQDIALPPAISAGPEILKILPALQRINGRPREVYWLEIGG